ncbi:hypothetical protein DdX_16811 [Ditylenchus destructor]|uniref:Uncharacterized protein n=1 Tax=Ditylenchus destructor TaxID=166010 RepID=A0AAD4MND3_9BILA|nr:hypothetical protein DdX_16811 [Ditylenchus destructor]
MSWSLFLLVISACLIQDIQSAPKAMGDSLDSRFTPCEQCQMLAFTVLHADGDPVLGGARSVEIICQHERLSEQFCSQIQGKEAEFADTVLDLKKNGTESEICAHYNFSDCDLSDFGKNWTSKPLNTCEQCQTIVDMIMARASYDQIINGSTNVPSNEMPFERLEYYKVAADGLKNNCRTVDIGPHISGLCTSIDGKEFEFVKAVMDCSGVKFKDDNVQPNCTATGQVTDSKESKQHPERKVCESYVEFCKVDQFPGPFEV